MKTPMDVVARLIERIEASPDHRAIVTGLEHRRWSDAVRALLKAERLLVPADAADEVRCPGCTRLCFMEVERIPAPRGPAAQTFVICDKGEGPGGTIDIEPQDLLRWQSHPELFAAWLARVLGATRTPQPGGKGRWDLGLLRVGKDRQDYSLGFQDGRLALMTPKGFALLDKILDLDANGRLVVDRAMLKAEIGRNPVTANYQPDTSRRDWRKQTTNDIYADLLAEGLGIKEEFGDLSATDICKRLAKSPKNIRKAKAATILRRIGAQLG